GVRVGARSLSERSETKRGGLLCGGSGRFVSVALRASSLNGRGDGVRVGARSLSERSETKRGVPCPVVERAERDETRWAVVRRFGAFRLGRAARGLAQRPGASRRRPARLRSEVDHVAGEAVERLLQRLGQRR